MRRIVFVGLISLFLVLVTNCGSPEKSLFSRYFETVKFNDKTTMSTMAYEPIALEFTKWRLVSLTQEEKRSLPLNDLYKKQDELKVKRDDVINQLADLKDKLDEAKAKLEKARGGAKKKAQEEVDNAEKAYQEGRAQYEQVQKEWNTLKGEIDKERALFNLSVGIEWPEGVELEGDMAVKEASLEITTPKDVRNYKAILRKYNVKSPETGQILPSRWIIEKFVLQ
jgi:archaellum component FlaC